MKKLTTFVLLIGILMTSVLVISCKKEEENNPEESGTFTDARDGKTYQWKKIGDLKWMTENLAYIPTGKVTGYLAYDNNEGNVPTYGYLYQYDTAKLIAPEGWRLPTKAELYKLVDDLGGDVPAYNKLIESGTSHWESPNEATNESGFTALPGGHYNPVQGEFWGLGKQAVFVSSELYPDSETSVMVLNLNRNFLDASVEGNPRSFYYSIRCVKD